MAYNIDFLRSVSAAGAGAAYQTEGRDLAFIQVVGSFTSAKIALEGRTSAEGGWERIGFFDANAPNYTLSIINRNGIYECPIFGLSEIRFNVLFIDGGSVSVMGVFYDTETGETYPYEEIGETDMIKMGGSNLFVKGVAEQTFMDPATGNIVGYDRTATNASVVTQVNLQEVIGGMGQQLVGVLPDSVRINGTYESAAFSLETREKIMGGKLAYDAVASVCEKITADDSGELTVSQKPAPFYGEGSLPDVQVPVYAEITDKGSAVLTTENEVLLNSFIAGIEPVQTGSGDPSPENIKPIAGWEGAVIRRTGKNLWGGDAILADVKADMPTATVDDENRTVRFGNSDADYGSLCGRNPVVQTKRGFQFEESKRYTFVLTVSNSADKTNLMVKYTDGTNVNIQSIEANVKKTIVYVSTAGKSVACLARRRSTGITTIYADESGIFEGVLTADDFVPYEGSETTVVFPSAAGTVYGGTLNLTTGTLTSEWANIDSYAGETLPGEWFSSMDVYAPGATPTTGAQVVYKLDTPAVYSLTPVQFETLAGYNTFTADCGPVQYLKCVKEWKTEEADGNVFRAYIRESGAATYSGESYGVDAKTQKVVGFAPEEGKTYEVTYYTHNASAAMLPIPTMWNPVVMTVQVKYGVYAKQGSGDTTNQGVLKGWLYFIVPRAMLTADAGVNASQTGTATTDGSWMALTNKAENLPMCADCGDSSEPMAYYVFAPCGNQNDAVVGIVSIGSGMALAPGQKKQLSLKLVMPDDSLIQPDFATLNYSSDDETVAIVSNTGIVTGVGAGTTYINAYVGKSDGTSLTAKTIVVVS